MSKYTPGPWEVRNNDTIVGPAGNVVAECCGYSVKAIDPAQQAQGGREANAQLIAAAPELAEACKAALSTMEWAQRSVPGTDLRSDILKLRAALRKAGL
jgi:hypothetical protein